MTHLIDKDAVVAEIEEIEKALKKACKPNPFGNLECMTDAELQALDVVKETINTLEVKEVDLEGAHYKPLDEDFERDAVSFCFDHGLNTTPHIAKTIAKHFFELGLKAQKGE